METHLLIRRWTQAVHRSPRQFIASGNIRFLVRSRPEPSAVRGEWLPTWLPYAGRWTATSNPSGTLIVTAAEDAVRVWNVADQLLHTEIAATAGRTRIATFIDDTHLLVVPQHSAVAIVITLDPADLLEVAHSRVTRAFRDDECATYDIDPCPTTLEVLRGG